MPKHPFVGHAGVNEGSERDRAFPTVAMDCKSFCSLRWGCEALVGRWEEKKINGSGMGGYCAGQKHFRILLSSVISYLSVA